MQNICNANVEAPVLSHWNTVWCILDNAYLVMMAESRFPGKNINT